MEQCEDTEEGAPPSKTSRSEKYEAQRDQQEDSKAYSHQSDEPYQTDLDYIFMPLKENIAIFVQNELKRLQRALSPDYPSFSESHCEDEEVLDSEDEKQQRHSRDAFLKITLHFLRRMKKDELADLLQSMTGEFIWIPTEMNITIHNKRYTRRHDNTSL
ncbi:uncharacterized protein LOC121509541 [Cheilinus undulatus]|uniref:uncharacterized protein LOC121509541 n=1 Tax=Cheilinus undulatus TaxID=241271 RepID=UPI001BD4C437|nr:uncharacterized protein LOC121509541 [Cheilinus undulatus]XP_041642916.1 uncharacterized protein LOC121509541 [Cheilinus undulatus]